MSQSLGIAWSSEVAGSGKAPAEKQQDTIVLVQAALAIACAYLVLFSETADGRFEIGAVVIIAFLLSNLIVGRLPSAAIGTRRFQIGIALPGSLLIAAALYVAGQLSIELVMLCLGILVLAIAGLRIGPIAIATLAMTAVYLVVLWATNSEPMLRSSLLLRVPFLFTAAIVYAWLVELGRGKHSDPPSSVGGDLNGDLSAQLQAIKRCQAAIAEGSNDGIENALRDIAEQNQAMQGRLAPAQR